MQWSDKQLAARGSLAAKQPKALVAVWAVEGCLGNMKVWTAVLQLQHVRPITCLSHAGTTQPVSPTCSSRRFRVIGA